jgi:hypothetical protein
VPLLLAKQPEPALAAWDFTMDRDAPEPDLHRLAARLAHVILDPRLGGEQMSGSGMPRFSSSPEGRSPLRSATIPRHRRSRIAPPISASCLAKPWPP